MPAAQQQIKTPMKDLIIGYILRHEITSTVSAMAGSVAKNVKVIFDRDDAYTDGKNFIVIPAIANGQQYEPDPAKVLRGYSNHEVAHILYSDLEEMLSFIKRHFASSLISIMFPPKGTPRATTNALMAQLSPADVKEYWRYTLWKSLENCIEDWRIESRVAIDWPGSYLNIGQTRRHVVTRELDRLSEGHFDDKKSPQPLLPMVTWRGCVQNRYPCSPLAQTCLEKSALKWPEEAKILDDFWPEAIACVSHEEVMALADRISHELTDQFYDPPQQRQPQPPQKAPPKPPAQQPPQNPGNGPADQPPPPSDDSSGAPGDGEGEGAGEKPGEDENDDKNDKPSEKDDSQKADKDDKPSEDEGDTQSDQTSKSNSNAKDKPKDDNGSSDDSDSADDKANDSADDQQDPSPDNDPSGKADGDEDAKSEPTPDPNQPSTPAPAMGDGDPDAVTDDDTTDNAGTSPAPSGQSPAQKLDGPGQKPDSAAPPQDQGAPGTGGAIASAADLDYDALDISDIVEIIKAISAQSPSCDDDRELVISRHETSDPVAYRDVLQACGAAASQTADSLRRLLMARSERQDRRYLEDGHLDMKNVIGMAIGDTNVYRRRTMSPLPTAAIYFCLDHSASMTIKVANAGCSRFDMLNRAAALILNAISKFKDISTAISTYTTDGDGVQIVTVKDFNDSAEQGKAALGGMSKGEGVFGGTPSDLALFESLRIIKKRPETKKIIFFITDGEPDDNRQTLEAANAILQSGVILIGIGIGESAPKMPIPGWIKIANIDQLPNELLSIVSAVLNPDSA